MRDLRLTIIEWLCPSIAHELQACEQDADRDDVLRRSFHGVLTPTRLMIGLSVGMAIAIATINVALARRPSPFSLTAMLALSAVIALIWLGKRLFAAKLVRQVRLELRARGFRVCMRCGYWLRGVAEPTCPECGTALYTKARWVEE